MANTWKFWKFWMANTQNFEHFGKMDPCLRVFPLKSGPMSKDFLWKNDPYGRHIPVYLIYLSTPLIQGFYFQTKNILILCPFMFDNDLLWLHNMMSLVQLGVRKVRVLKYKSQPIHFDIPYSLIQVMHACFIALQSNLNQNFVQWFMCK